MTNEAMHARLLRVQDGLYQGARVICVTLLGLIVLAISTAVIARFVIFTPLNFADPLSKYLMQWMAFLGLGMAMARGEHVAVTALSDRLGLRAARALALAIAMAVGALFLVILVYGAQYAWSGRTSSDPFVFGVPMIVPYLSVAVGALYALIQSLLSAGIILTGPADADPRPQPDVQGI